MAGEIRSQLEDLRNVPLDLLAGSGDAVADAVARVLPDKDGPRVPVAAFNSMI